MRGCERSSNVSLLRIVGDPGATRRRPAPSSRPRTGTPAFTFGPDGMLRSGVLTQPTGDWLGGSTQGNLRLRLGGAGLALRELLRPQPDGSPSTCATQRKASIVANEARNFDHSEGTRDIAANLRWDVNDELRTTFDLQHIEADTNNYDILVVQSHDGECAVRSQSRRHAAHHAAAGIQCELRAGLSRESAQLLHPVHPGSLRGQRGGRRWPRACDLEYQLGRRTAGSIR